MNLETISVLSEEESYKYLGINQALDIKTSEMKYIFREGLYKTVNLLLKSSFNSKSLFTAIHIWPIPSITYSFGILASSQSDLREIDRKNKNHANEERHALSSLVHHKTLPPEKKWGKGNTSDSGPVNSN